MITIKQNSFASRTFASSVLQGAGETISGGSTSEEGGWFRRNWKKLAGGVAAVIGGPVGLILGGILNSGLFDRSLNAPLLEIGIADEVGLPTISEYEAGILETWFSNVFVKKYEILIQKANIIFNTKDASLQVKLINELNNELAVTKQFLLNENPKLTSQALSIRNSICSDLIFEIEKIIYNSIENSEVEYIAENVTIKSTPGMLYPIYSIVQFEATATNYTIGKTLSTSGSTTNQTTFSETDSTSTKEKSSTGLVLAGAGLLTLAFLYSKDDKDKKKKK